MKLTDTNRSRTYPKTILERLNLIAEETTLRMRHPVVTPGTHIVWALSSFERTTLNKFISLLRRGPRDSRKQELERVSVWVDT